MAGKSKENTNIHIERMFIEDCKEILGVLKKLNKKDRDIIESNIENGKLQMALAISKQNLVESRLVVSIKPQNLPTSDITVKPMTIATKKSEKSGKSSDKTNANTNAIAETVKSSNDKKKSHEVSVVAVGRALRSNGINSEKNVDSNAIGRTMKKSNSNAVMMLTKSRNLKENQAVDNPEMKDAEVEVKVRPKRSAAITCYNEDALSKRFKYQE